MGLTKKAPCSTRLPETGLEPVQDIIPGDFKTGVSAGLAVRRCRILLQRRELYYIHFLAYAVISLAIPQVNVTFHVTRKPRIMRGSGIDD
jgi:hypothetical protein